MPLPPPPPSPEKCSNNSGVPEQSQSGSVLGGQTLGQSVASLTPISHKEGQRQHVQRLKDPSKFSLTWEVLMPGGASAPQTDTAGDRSPSSASTVLLEVRSSAGGHLAHHPPPPSDRIHGRSHHTLIWSSRSFTSLKNSAALDVFPHVPINK